MKERKKERKKKESKTESKTESTKESKTESKKESQVKMRKKIGNGNLLQDFWLKRKKKISAGNGYFLCVFDNDERHLRLNDGRTDRPLGALQQRGANGR